MQLLYLEIFSVLHSTPFMIAVTIRLSLTQIHGCMHVVDAIAARFLWDTGRNLVNTLAYLCRYPYITYSTSKAPENSIFFSVSVRSLILATTL